MHAVRQLLLIGLSGLVFSTLIDTVAAVDPAFSEANKGNVLQGTVTLVDTNRGLIVIQDGEHPRAIKLDSIPEPPHIGDRIEIDGAASPYFKVFPDYPNTPSGREIASSFEAPKDWAKHYLTRMRGFLQPPADGEYTFWIAGDDEAELFLSSNKEAARTTKIAFTPRATWPREWDRYPQQKSEPIFLKADHTYYIEALQRQWRGHDCLGVAWEGPGIRQSVIDGKYLSPVKGNWPKPDHGILR
jgi:hypothetical protein